MSISISNLANPLKLIRYAEWIIRRSFLKQESYIVNIYSNKMAIDLKVAGVSRALAIHRAREHDHTYLFRREVKKGMTMLDVGANIGYYTLMASDLVGTEGKVLAIEPDPRNITLLKRNIQLNPNLRNIEIFPIAVSNRSGKATMFQAKASNLNTLLAAAERTHLTDRDHEGKEISIQTTTIDDFLKTQKLTVNFIRMDIEGYELEAIEGMLNSLKEMPPPVKLLIETHPVAYNNQNRDFGKMLQTLYSLSFIPKALVSAGKSFESFSNIGYEPIKTFEESGFIRGIFENVSIDHAVKLVMQQPKVVRYILLSKE